MRKSLFLLSITFCASVIVFSACSGNKTKMLVGKWSLYDISQDGKSFKSKQLDSNTTMRIKANLDKIQMIFNADGTFDDGSKKDALDKKAEKVTYALSADAKKLTMKVMNTKDSLVMEVTMLSKDTLKVIPQNQSPVGPKTAMTFFKKK